MDRILEFFHPFLQIWPVSLVLLAIAIHFLTWGFVIPALKLKRKLSLAIWELAHIEKQLDGKVIDLALIVDKAMTSLELKHAWSEYAETLHAQHDVDETGQRRVARWRATTLAEAFFSEHIVVGIPLKTEFFKHVPGILTGLGIIGTFLGLINGLSDFDIADPGQSQSELKSLIGAVGDAFHVSMGAIILAVLFTWIEKSLVTACYRRLGQLWESVDKLFAAGAGEEYLARLVESSETQATQAAHIKDALVADLKEILTTLIERQMDAQAQQSGQISADMGKAIAEHLGGPIADIATSVKGVSTNQGEAVNKMLTDVLAGFSAQLEGMFGGQMRGMSDLLKATSEAMQASAEKFSVLAKDMDAAGTGIVDAMGKRLTTAITAMEARQQTMNKQMGDFVSQIGQVVANQQSEAVGKFQETLAAVGDQVYGMVEELRRQAEAASEAQGRRQEQFETTTSQAVASLSAQVENLLTQSVETNHALQETVVKLSNATGEAITGLNQGAETLSIATSDFAKAGQGVMETMRAATEATRNLQVATATLNSAISATKDVLADYARTRESFVGILAELKSIVDNARRDATVTSELVARIEAAAQKLGDAQRLSEEYLIGINEVLAKSHESFAEHVSRTLREGNRQFQDELRRAVDMVSGAVRDLADTLEEIPTRER